MTGLLVFAVILFSVIAVIQLVRVFELTGELKERKEWEISRKDNKLNATLMLLFVIGFIIYVYGYIFSYKDKLLPESASAHGNDIDWLLNFNFLIILIVFTVTHILLFWYSFKYYYREDRKAQFFTHSNKLELIWTCVPAVVLAVIIVLGLKTWNNIMDESPEDALVIELYSKQFDWTARYAGEDGTLGGFHYKNIGGTNALGLDTNDTKAFDDILVKGEFHLPVNKPVEFVFRSQDVIHSAYMPHFRAQMNTVPGMTTRFKFTPTITTEEMRKKPLVKKKIDNINKLRMEQGKDLYEFNYVLLCNKICGASHYNMQMDIIVESEEDYKAWLAEQKPFKEVEGGAQVGAVKSTEKEQLATNNE